MKVRFVSLILVVWCSAAWADFSKINGHVHPIYTEGNAPFIVDIRGEWSTDCHPGEQKPVIREYTGDSALIEFQTIVERVTCNEGVTPYRVLVDMSDVVGSVEGEFPILDLTIRFDGSEAELQVNRLCLLCDPPPPPRDVKPEAGLYGSDGLEKQGLLLARQNQRMAVYPLIYDESGSSEWVFSPGGIVEDTFFATLYELTGGQCLGCPPPAEEPTLGEVGKLTLLIDDQETVQMRINDGMFIAYAQSAFGYGGFVIQDADEETLVRAPDLSGRWAFSDDESVFDETTPPPTAVLPLVFDVTLRSNVNDPPPPTIGVPPPVQGPAINVFYSILNMEGQQVAQMLCEHNGEMVCDLKMPDIEHGEFDEWFEVRFLSVERMVMKNMAPNDPRDSIGIGTGIAVRID